MVIRYIIKSSLILIIVILLSCTGNDQSPDDHEAPIAHQEYRFGILANLYEKMNDQALSAGLFTHLDTLDVDMIREVFAMDWFMPARDTYDEHVIALYDTLIDQARQHNIEILGLIDYENSWSTQNYYAPYEEQHFEDFANFVSFIVNRYKDTITCWEIGNEPEVAEYWKPAPNAVNYTHLLRYGYIAAKAADPECTVIGFSGFSSSRDFLQTVIDNDGLLYMDILGIHPYCYSDPTYKSIFEISDEYHVIDEIRDRMTTYGKTLPIRVTEVGYPTYTGEYGVDEERQAQMLVRTHVLLIAAEIGHIFLATLIDETDDITFSDENFGILTHDLMLKKSYTAYRSMIDLLKDTTLQEEIDVGEKNKAFSFDDKNNHTILVIWTFDEQIRTTDGNVTVTGTNITLDITGTVDHIYDIYKNEQPVTMSKSGLSLTLDGSPLYIIGDFSIN